jgi:hypothetical protein
MGYSFTVPDFWVGFIVGALALLALFIIIAVIKSVDER